MRAACLVQRRGRLGWFLDDVRGPRNSDIEPERLDTIQRAFANAGIPLILLIEPITRVIEYEKLTPSRRGELAQMVQDEEVALLARLGT